MQNAKNSKPISLTVLVLMIFSAMFGFSNIPTAYDQMGYASIIWYVVGALAFFLPTSLMFAEFGSALKNESGGIYSWIKSGLGERWAFIGGFMWLVAWVITILQNAPHLWISLSAAIFGKDTTQTWHVWGMNSTQTLGLLSIVFIIVITMIAVKGLNNIAFIAAIGGVMSVLLPFIFCGLSVIVIFLNHGQLAQPISGFRSFLVSPNPQFQNPMSAISFVVYAIFAYAGIESVCGVINHLKNPSKTFPRGVLIATVVIFALYTISIILCGFVINWHGVMGKSSVTLGNVEYVLMDNLGISIAHGLGLTQATSLVVGHGLTIFSGIADLLGGIGELLVLLYSPIKSFMFGANKKIWPKWALHLNPEGMPSHAMAVQGGIICIILFFLSFCGNTSKMLFQILTDMNNVSSTFQYVLIVLAFPFFKKALDMKRPFIAFHSKWSTWAVTILVLAVLAFGIIFNFIQPIIIHHYMDDFWTFLGPILFGGAAWIFYDYRAKEFHITDK